MAYIYCAYWYVGGGYNPHVRTLENGETRELEDGTLREVEW